mmetsp:Transcript_6251/g.25236  ORF Transcript_6251/g.25236 Transcript_6251/m.25236 type:complete len:354 (+) Transcript_6251:100-1161(+)|eukprot:CAMPEP_0114606256 /NCGR_PEP_ID=MMETSP0168-20121206/1469_1 /TAXON_ID=95228 ORGANISM="Vannella sp., Strain DIVA3 517/6/12" /NCGR_SAMPLE_ID=MMETSP0168 /ASSEMBLY_ACC=CAM_ASM_000044 /LENGTH=353 /DNA_ID=CAMNT_0001817117 /DNA_START=215 /DNA_END=1276 /DNA_ORIENTATION=+
MAHPQDAHIGTLHNAGEQEITFEVLASLFHLPLSMAAQQLGVCCTALKKKCRKNGISRWPYRTLQSIDKMIKAIETSPQNERANIELEYLQSKRDVIMRKPTFAAKSPPRQRANLDVKKTISKPSAYAARAARSSIGNPLDVLQEAAKYADTPSTGRRLAPATHSAFVAEPRLQYQPQQYSAPAQGYEPPYNGQMAGYYLQPVSASYSASQTYAQAGHHFSMHQSLSARMPQSGSQQQHQQQQQHQPIYQPAQQPVSFTFHAARQPTPAKQVSAPKSAPVQPKKVAPAPAPRAPPATSNSQASGSPPANWTFELPQLRLPDEGPSTGNTLPKLRTLEPSAFASLRPAIESSMA